MFFQTIVNEVEIVPTPVDPCIVNIKVNTIVQEDVAPVKPKCLSKALTPPITIKNFFKPAVKGHDIGKKGSESESFKENGDIYHSRSECSKVNSDGEVPSDYEVQDAAQTGAESNKDTQSEKDSLEKPVLTSKCAKKGQKRTLNDMFSKTPAKKAKKQGNIMNLFAKQKTEKEPKDKKSSTCPICNKEFDRGAWNTDINNHIDNCLIE